MNFSSSFPLYIADCDYLLKEINRLQICKTVRDTMQELSSVKPTIKKMFYVDLISFGFYFY